MYDCKITVKRLDFSPQEGEGCFKWASLAESVRQRIMPPAAETESFAVFFITCCAATDAFIMVIVKARCGGPPASK